MEHGRVATATDEVGAATQHVLVIEDDRQTRDMLTRALARAGFAVRAATSETDARRCIRARWPQLVVMDIRYWEPATGSRFDWLAATADVLVVMVSPSDDAYERSRALELGADDFVPAPLLAAEFVARVRSVLRRVRPSSDAEPAKQVVAGPLRLDPETRRVRVRGRWVTLTAREFALLEFLVRRPRHTFSRESLLEHVWGYTVGDASTVTVHVRRLREKIEPDPARPVLIVTVWGAGYHFDPFAGDDTDPDGSA